MLQLTGSYHWIDVGYNNTPTIAPQPLSVEPSHHSDEEAHTMSNTDIDPSSIDLSKTIYESSEDVTVIDSNGQKYLAGEDMHGWFSITMVALRSDEGVDSDYEWIAQPEGEFPSFNFTGSGLEKLIEAAQ